MNEIDYVFCGECCKVKHEDNFITCILCGSLIKSMSINASQNTYICNATLCARNAKTIDNNGVLQPICYGCHFKQLYSRFKKIK